MDEEGSPTLPDHPVDYARRVVILDELRHQAGQQAYVKDQILRWEEQIRLRTAAKLLSQPALSGGPPLPTEQREVDLFFGRATRRPPEYEEKA